MPSKKTVAVRGSKKNPLPGARVIAPAAPDERVEVTIRIRPRHPLPPKADLLAPLARPPILDHAAFEKRYGADPKDVAKVRKFAKDNDLTVVKATAASRSVLVSGTVADMSKAFGVTLQVYSYPHGTYRGRTGSVKIPADLAPIVEGVFGLDNRPVAKRHVRIRRATAAASDGAGSMDPGTIASLYDFPTGVTGAGQTIGIIELGGGYRPADLEHYFASLTPPVPMPTVIPVSIDGATNAPGGPDDAEVVLDIEVAGAIAPGATIVVYFAKNDRGSKSFLDALTAAVHDRTHNPSVISISWGGPEQEAGTGFQQQFDQVLQSAAMLGITVCVAAGDDGAADMGPKGWDGLAHVDFPSSSPFALACGGTRLIANGNTIARESVWNQHSADISTDAGPDGSFGATGGGISTAFPSPAYQKAAAGGTGRGVPDVTGDGDPDSGYNILLEQRGHRRRRHQRRRPAVGGACGAHQPKTRRTRRVH